MTRFEATSKSERLSLFADAATAHRTRSSSVMTIEIDIDNDNINGSKTPPWIQLASTEAIMDCTDEELNRLKDLLGNFPEFRIDELVGPKESDGTKTVITARADADRIAEFIERAFREVYNLNPAYRAWVTRI